MLRSVMDQDDPEEPEDEEVLLDPDPPQRFYECVCDQCMGLLAPPDDE